MRFGPLEQMSAEDQAFGSIGKLTYCDNVTIEFRRPTLMQGLHWHGHIEVVIPFDGELTYQFDEELFTIREGSMGLFWATIPHRLIQINQCDKVGIINIPLHIMSFWPIDDDILSDLMRGCVINFNTEDQVDKLKLSRWYRNIKYADSPYYQLVIEEISLMIRWACVNRWSYLIGDEYRESNNIMRVSSHMQTHIQTLIKYIAKNFSEDIKTDDIAEAAGLHPNYAMQIFKQAMKMTIKDYILTLRITYAKSMLADTDIPVTDVGYAVGFQSKSRFYDCFQKDAGCTPKNFRIISRGAN